MKKKLFILLTLVFLVIISTGCSYRELNDLAISTVLGIDYIPSKDEYKVTAQVFDFSKTDSNNVNEGIIVYAGEGKTIAKAIRNIYLKYPQVLHLGHLQLLILGKDVIKDETNTIFDYFLRSPETSSDCYVMISQDGTAYEILASNNKPEDAFNAKELLKGKDGKDGTNGISILSVEVGNITQEDNYTNTQLIINKSDGSQETVNIKSKNGLDGTDGQQGPSGTKGEDGKDGLNGEDGTTFTPKVSADGTLSWTNNKNLENPQTVNIKGPKGDTGEKGQDGISINCIKVASEEEAVLQSTVNPNNIYYW